MIEFKEDGSEYWFDEETGEYEYDGKYDEVLSTLDSVKGRAVDYEVTQEEDSPSGVAKERVYNPQKGRDMVLSLLEMYNDVSIMEKGKTGESGPQQPQIIEGPIGKDLTIYDNEVGILYKDIPDEAAHIGPDDDVPEGWVTFEGPRGGTYAMDPADVAEYAGDDVSAEEVLSEFGESDVADAPDDDPREATVESDIASEKIAPEDREIPDGVRGSIEDWHPDDVNEPVLSPNMRFAEIGSEAHPAFWTRPEPNELDEYVEGLRQDEEWSSGKEGFDSSFHDGDNSASDHQDEDGNWDEEREQQHREWANDLLNENAVAEEGEEPVGMVVLGPPGAGKGWWQEQVEDGQYGDTLGDREFTHVNSDETKEPVPEYNGTNASYVHEEASKIAKEDLFPQAAGENQNIMLDKVATSPDSTIRMLSELQERGYDIRASFVDVPEEKAVHNAVSRFYMEGRFTPMDYILEGAGGDSAREGSRESFEAVIEELGIPEEKVGEFNNDVEWGNAPDGEQIGEELLKTILEFYGVDLVNKYLR